MHPTSQSFKDNAHSALTNDTLQRALRKATGRFVNERAHAVGERPDFQVLREQGRAIKADALERLPELLEQFEEQVVARGGQVHWARTASEANAIVLRIAKAEGVTRVVKSKSMATEETNLNEALEGGGLEVVETDLGEYILQLDHDYPSHIIAPAVHKTKEQVADIFERELHEKNPPDAGIPGLNAIARRALRSKFLSSQMGITGANFAVAETGTLVVVENEGNAALTSTVPRIHVAMVGIEKIVPRFDDLRVMLKLLARSATGQRLTSYTNFLTGVAKEGLEGPRQLHIVLLDNGRTKIYDDPKLAGSLRCIRCGACLNACPVYQKTGGHAYGWVYSGPIGAVITPQYLGVNNAQPLPFASSLCGACYEVCPVKIEIPHMLLELRQKVIDGEIAKQAQDGEHAAKPRKSLDRIMEGLSFKMFSMAATRPWLWRLGTNIARVLLRSKASGGQISSLPYPVVRNWTQVRDLPAPARESFMSQWRSQRGVSAPVVEQAPPAERKAE